MCICMHTPGVTDFILDEYDHALCDHVKMAAGITTVQVAVTTCTHVCYGWK